MGTIPGTSSRISVDAVLLARAKFDLRGQYVAGTCHSPQTPNPKWHRPGRHVRVQFHL